MRRPTTTRARILVVAFLGYLAVACAVQGPGSGPRHRWWSGLGPVLPHDTFPADCRLCHLGEKWHDLRADFTFDHRRETGLELVGQHAAAQCLRCHNDRGPVAVFWARGCSGCHEDVHQGDLGQQCDRCHDQRTWRPVGQVAMHARTRFPLTGAHLATACHRCHPGAFVGNFQPNSPECVTCHQRDLARTTNPPHIPLGWVSDCDRCHVPTRWQHGRVR